MVAEGRKKHTHPKLKEKFAWSGEEDPKISASAFIKDVEKAGIANVHP